MKKIFFTIISAILISGLLAACSNTSSAKEKGDTVTLRLAHNQPEDHPVDESLNKFAKLVKEKTDDDVRVKIYPNGQLGEEKEVVESTQNGTIDLTKVSSNTLESFDDAYKVFSAPFLIKNQEHLYKVMDSDIAEDIYQSTKDKGIIGLTWYDAGGRNFYTNKDRAIEKPKDLKGLKIRTQPSDILEKNIELLGGGPTFMDFGELYTAMQQNVVDGAENNVTAMTDQKLGEVTKHFSYDEHMFSPDILVMGKSAQEKLNSNQQKAVKEAAEESTEYHKKVWNDAVAKDKKIAKEMGVEFHYPDKGPFKEATKSLREHFKHADATAEYYKRIKKAGEDIKDENGEQ